MKFLCDQMLGTLAKWLRIYGFDTFYTNSKVKDSELLDISMKENRTLITRDKLLYKNAKKNNICVIEIKTTDIDEQLRVVLKNSFIRDELFLTRCLICNSRISRIKKEYIKDIVPKKSFRNNDEFWQCKKCNKIYWKGSHYKKMLEKINNL
jgi:uncharacterized protein with PIN domain